jgi:hypothetical protein
MSELSKTARASMGRQVKEVHVETTEEAIKAIRDNRVAKLFIGDMSRVDKLLKALDDCTNELVISDEKRIRAEDQLAETEQKLLDVSSAYDAVKDELEVTKKELANRIHSELDASERARKAENALDDADDTLLNARAEPVLVMASIPNGELEHADFGHDNTHSHHEGA